MHNDSKSGFSNFRELMDLWDDYVFNETVENELEKFLDHKQLVMFFLYPDIKNKNGKGKKLYGTTEDGRLSFAKMKSPSPDDPPRSDDNFQAFDLETLITKSDEPEDLQRIKIFNKKDLNKIKIVSKDFVVKKLSKGNITKKLKPVEDPGEPKVFIDDE